MKQKVPWLLPSPHLQGPATVTVSLAGPWLRPDIAWPSPALPSRHTTPHSQLTPPTATPHHRFLHPRQAHLGPPPPSMTVRGALQPLPALGPPGAAPAPSQAALLLPPCRPAPSLGPCSPGSTVVCTWGWGEQRRVSDPAL